MVFDGGCGNGEEAVSIVVSVAGRLCRRCYRLMGGDANGLFYFIFILFYFISCFLNYFMYKIAKVTILLILIW